MTTATDRVAVRMDPDLKQQIKTAAEADKRTMSSYIVRAVERDLANEPPAKQAYHAGAYEMCALLLTSPRFNKAQREVIEGQAYVQKAKLEDLGMTFLEPTP